MSSPLAIALKLLKLAAKQALEDRRVTALACIETARTAVEFAYAAETQEIEMRAERAAALLAENNERN